MATILVIRLQLWATHYPKLGGGQLHITHLLWGGLGMLIAIVLLLSFLGRARRHTGAVVGGIGFGFFVDELGKFVTLDNDYFFKPAAGMIYIVFILLFLAIRSLGWRHRWTPQECTQRDTAPRRRSTRGVSSTAASASTGSASPDWRPHWWQAD